MRTDILHMSPTYYSERSVIGGGEKYILYMSRAIRAASALAGTWVKDSIVAFGAEPGFYHLAEDITCEVMKGQPWDPQSINLHELAARIRTATVVVVHQCLSTFGLFVAAHGRLANKIVIGIDEGGGEDVVVHRTPEIGRIFDLFHAYSTFCTHSFKDIEGRVEVIPGPVDTSYYRPDGAVPRDPELVLAVGRILPHKGFDRIIRVLPRHMKLVIVGTNCDQGYHDYLNDLGKGSRMEIREHLTDTEVLGLLQRASIFVQASAHVDFRGRYHAKPELLGLAPLEALSCGTPTLVSSAGALPELATLEGCLQFRDDEQLADLLARQSEVTKSFPSANEIHRNVAEAYGLEVFGKRFLAAIAAASVQYENTCR